MVCGSAGCLAGIGATLGCSIVIISKKAFPRAGLIGNPSDGYFGKTISFTFSNFCAEVVLYETPELEILPNTRDHSRFHSIDELVADVRLCGYYGGIRLLKAAVKRFHDYCSAEGIRLHDKNFTIRYSSDIPHLVGLAGSSAIITAGMRALMAFYGIDIPLPVLANYVLSVEKDELGISGGLQDRVAQVYQGVMYMDFQRELLESRGYGKYERIDSERLPPLYIAYRQDLSEGSFVFHGNLRERFAKQDPELLDAIRTWTTLTESVREALLAGRGQELGPMLDANYDCRASIYRIGEGNVKLVQAARSVGASAKFTGSGGAIIGTYRDAAMLSALEEVLEPLSARVIRPVIALPEDGGAE